MDRSNPPGRNCIDVKLCKPMLHGPRVVSMERKLDGLSHHRLVREPQEARYVQMWRKINQDQEEVRQRGPVLDTQYGNRLRVAEIRALVEGILTRQIELLAGDDPSIDPLTDALQAFKDAIEG
jgi:hypothetical protein